MKSLKYLLLSFTAVAQLSCDDFLQEDPKTNLYDKTVVYNNLQSANAALTGCYSTLASYSQYGFNYFHCLSVMSGLGVSLKTLDSDMGKMNMLPSNSYLNGLFQAQFSTIRSANDVIVGIKNSTIDSEKDKNEIMGEALFIRAVTYFNLVRMFGAVPLITERLEDYASAQIARTPVDDVYAQIIEDLNNAYEMMPDAGEEVEGRPHKYAAKSLLAKVYVTMASNNGPVKYWQKAYDAAKEVYDSKVYSLVRPYKNLFGQPNNNNAESIFEIQFSSQISSTSNRFTETTFPQGHDMMNNVVSKGSTWGLTRPTMSIFDRFYKVTYRDLPLSNDTLYDPRVNATFVYGRYTNIFADTEAQSRVLLYPTTKKAGTSGTGSNKLSYSQGHSDYPAWKKYYDTSMTTSVSSANFVYMRYADLILLLAEASNELGFADEAVKYLNEVIERAADVNGDGILSDSESSTINALYPRRNNKDRLTLRDEIFNQRLMELTGECDEWYTIRRMGPLYLQKIFKNHNDRVEEWFSMEGAIKGKFVYTYPTDMASVEKNLLFPIPIEEINRNEKISSEDQNPGY